MRSAWEGGTGKQSTLLVFSFISCKVRLLLPRSLKHTMTTLLVTEDGVVLVRIFTALISFLFIILFMYVYSFTIFLFIHLFIHVITDELSLMQIVL